MTCVKSFGVLFFFAAITFASAHLTFEDHKLESVVSTVNELLKVRFALEEAVKALIAQKSDNSSAQYKALKSQLDSLQVFVEARAEHDDKQAVAQAVTRGYFKLADEKLLALSNFEKHVPSIVHEAYAYSESNFERVLDWAKQPNAAASHEILKSLHKEMRACGHYNPYNVIKLADKLQNQMEDGSENVKKSAATILAELGGPIKDKAAELLLQGLNTDNGHNATEIRTVTAVLYKLDPEQTDKVMQDFVDAAVNETVDAHIYHVLGYLFNHTTTAQAALGMKALYWKLREASQLNEKVQLKIASLLSQVQNRLEYSTLSPAQRSSVDQVMINLPTCFRNLFSSPRVCLWSRQVEAYLVASSNFPDDDNRQVEIDRAASPPPEAAWFVQEINGKILFHSSVYLNEYIYVSDCQPYELAEVQEVCTWVPGGTRGYTSAFEIELQGDYCYIKISRDNQFMHVSDFNPKIVVTSNFDQVQREKFLWQIRRCHPV